MQPDRSAVCPNCGHALAKTNRGWWWCSRCERRMRLKDSVGGSALLTSGAARQASFTPTDSAAQSQRDPACVGRWPECESGAYDPRCCRFPKSCSCVSSAASTDPMTRIAEIRQENRGGDVSATDIDWLLAVAEAAVWLTKAPFGSIRERHFYRTREALNRD